MRQHYLLGAELRNRYIYNQDLIIPYYFQPEVYVFSTDVNRTIMSAQSQIQGFFPYGTGPNLRSIAMETASIPPINVTAEKQLISNLQLMALPNLTQVIPIHTDLETRQFALDSISSCSYYSTLINYRFSEPGLNDIYLQYPDVINTIMQVLGYNQSYAESMALTICDSLVCNQFVNNPIPQGFNETFIKRIQMLENDIIGYVSRQPDFLARLGGTALMNLILADLTAAMNDQNTIDFFFYSGHDTTVATALAYLQLNIPSNPPFASTLIFELTESNSEYFVALKYNDAYQMIPTCPNYNCSFYNFTRYIEFRAIPDIEYVCNFNASSISSTELRYANSKSFHLPGHNDVENNDVKWYFLLPIILYVILIVLLVILLVFNLLMKKRIERKPSTEKNFSLARNMKYQ